MKLGLLVFVAVPMGLALSLGSFSVDGFGGYKFVGLKPPAEIFNSSLIPQHPTLENFLSDGASCDVSRSPEFEGLSALNSWNSLIPGP